jgi:hypothetical protein
MLKHVGRIKKNQKKCVVAYRLVPGTTDEAIIVPTETLMAEEHDSLMKLVESNAGQTAYEFAEAMARTQLPDGRVMLAGFHTTGRMLKVKTSDIEMTPDMKTTISLDELNATIAQQRGVTVADLALSDPNASAEPKKVTESVDPVDLYNQTSTTTNEDTVLTDEMLAAQYRSQADSLFKEAKKLREQAKEITDRLKSEEVSG